MAKRSVAEGGEKRIKSMMEDWIRKGEKEEEPQVEEGKVLDRKNGMKVKNELDKQDLEYKTKNIN